MPAGRTVVGDLPGALVLRVGPQAREDAVLHCGLDRRLLSTPRDRLYVGLAERGMSSDAARSIFAALTWIVNDALRTEVGKMARC